MKLNELEIKILEKLEDGFKVNYNNFGVERNEFYIATKHLYDNNLIFAKKCEHKLFKDEIDPTGITEIGRKLLDQSR